MATAMIAANDLDESRFDFNMFVKWNPAQLICAQVKIMAEHIRNSWIKPYHEQFLLELTISALELMIKDKLNAAEATAAIIEGQRELNRALGNDHIIDGRFTMALGHTMQLAATILLADNLAIDSQEEYERGLYAVIQFLKNRV